MRIANRVRSGQQPAGFIQGPAGNGGPSGHEVPVAMDLRIADPVAADRATPPLRVVRQSGDHLDLMALPSKMLGQTSRIRRDPREFRSVIDPENENPQGRDRGQIPRLRRTRWMVLSKMPRSFPNDQVWMYERSTA